MLHPLLTCLRPSHPGELLRQDVLPAPGRSRTEIARARGMSRHARYGSLAERRPVTPQPAHRIGKRCGDGPELRPRMQGSYDLAVTAAATAASASAAMQTLAAA